jgi:hypothetical protein
MLLEDKLMSSRPKKAAEKERNGIRKGDARILLQLANLMLKDNLITPEEKIRLTQCIQRGGSK